MTSRGRFSGPVFSVMFPSISINNIFNKFLIHPHKSNKWDVRCQVGTPHEVCSRPILAPTPHILPPDHNSLGSALEGHIVAVHDLNRRSHCLRGRVLVFSNRPPMASLGDSAHNVYCCVPSIQSERTRCGQVRYGRSDLQISDAAIICVDSREGGFYPKTVPHRTSLIPTPTIALIP